MHITIIDANTDHPYCIQIDPQDEMIARNTSWILHDGHFLKYGTRRKLGQVLLGVPPAGKCLIFQNGDHYDFRRDNIYYGTRAEIQLRRARNKSKMDSTLPKGITRFRDKYQIKIGQKRIGLAETVLKAENILNDALRKMGIDMSPAPNLSPFISKPGTYNGYIAKAGLVFNKSGRQAFRIIYRTFGDNLMAKQEFARSHFPLAKTVISELLGITFDAKQLEWQSVPDLVNLRVTFEVEQKGRYTNAKLPRRYCSPVPEPKSKPVETPTATRNVLEMAGIVGNDFSMYSCHPEYVTGEPSSLI